MVSGAGRGIKGGLASPWGQEKPLVVGGEGSSGTRGGVAACCRTKPYPEGLWGGGEQACNHPLGLLRWHSGTKGVPVSHSPWGDTQYPGTPNDL